MERFEGAGRWGVGLWLVAQLDNVQVSCLYNELRDIHEVGTLIWEAGL